MSEAGEPRTDPAPPPGPANLPATVPGVFPPQAEVPPPAPALGAGRLRARRALPLALLAGALHAMAFAPAGLPWLELLALAAAFWLALGARSAARAAARGFAFGLGWFGVGVSWIYISLHGHGDLPAPLAALATAGLAAMLAAFPAAAAAAGTAAGAPDSLHRALALVAAWTLADWLRGVVLTGFPWLATGYAHTDGPLAGYAPLLGVYGVGALAALAVALALWGALCAWPQGQRRAALAALLASLALLQGGSVLRTLRWSEDAGAPIRVRLVQGDIPQDLKFGAGGLERSLERYLPALATPAGMPAPQLIVFPESAFPEPVSELPDEALRQLTDGHQRDGAALVFGAFIVEPELRYFNSAIGLDGDDSPAQRYSKRHLVPFGEFIPYGLHWFVRMLQIPIGDQQAGDTYQPPMHLAGQLVAVNICFEDLFGAEIRAAWHDPQRAPTVLLNLSNLAWFDDSIALPQHLQISRMRALETARPLLRATNTGVTAIIDARGQVQAQLAPLTAGVLEGVVQGQRGSTPFLRWGNAPALAGVVLLWLGCRWLRPRAPARLDAA